MFCCRAAPQAAPAWPQGRPAFAGLQELTRFPEGWRADFAPRLSKLSRVMPGCAAINHRNRIPLQPYGHHPRGNLIFPTIVGLSGACGMIENGALVTWMRALAKCMKVIFAATSVNVLLDCLWRFSGREFLKKSGTILLSRSPDRSREAGFIPSDANPFTNIMRFIHEKIFDVMFQFSDDAVRNDYNCLSVGRPSTLKLWILDVGDGLKKKEADRTRIQPSDIASLRCRPF